MRALTLPLSTNVSATMLHIKITEDIGFYAELLMG